MNRNGCIATEFLLNLISPTNLNLEMKQSTLFQAWKSGNAKNETAATGIRFNGQGTENEPINLFEDDDDDDELLLAAELHDTSTATTSNSRNGVYICNIL